MTKVFVVQDGSYDSGSIDSVWTEKEPAEARAAELRAHERPHLGPDDPNWEVVIVRVNEPDGAEWFTSTGPGDQNG